jgi:hypothetical protein
MFERTTNLGEYRGKIMRYNSVCGHEGRENNARCKEGTKHVFTEKCRETNPNNETNKMKE